MTPKQKEAWRINWGLMILSSFEGLLWTYKRQTTIKFHALEKAIVESRKALLCLRVKKEVRGD